ncbi:MAG: branched-chain amino acid ABC transporter permease [Calditrichaeota bacterium]|nr:MAG: branched-chain amino acid ABC transporter permease [Calditrichota bacterium]
MDMKRDYYEDVQFLKNPPAKFWFGLLLVALILFPFVSPNYDIYLVNYIAINIIVTLGLNLLVGYTGQISLGHAGFFAIGAYATVLLMLKFHLPFALAIFAAGFLAAGLGFLLGLPALRLEGPYLAIATLGFGMAVTTIIGRVPLFGGHMGLQAPPLAIGPLVAKSDREIYFVIMTFTVIMALAMRNLTHTRIGRAFVAIRDSEIAAQAVGVNLAYYKTLAFAISAFYAGIAGGLMAFVLGFINPNMFDLLLSILFLAMVVIGGPGTLLGSILGATVVSFLNLKLESLQTMPLLGEVLAQISKRWMSLAGLPYVSFIFFGLTLILIVMFERLGLYGLWLRVKIYCKTWPF